MTYIMMHLTQMQDIDTGRDEAQQNIPEPIILEIKRPLFMPKRRINKHERR